MNLSLCIEKSHFAAASTGVPSLIRNETVYSLYAYVLKSESENEPEYCPFWQFSAVNVTGCSSTVTVFSDSSLYVTFVVIPDVCAVSMPASV